MRVLLALVFFAIGAVRAQAAGPLPLPTGGVSSVLLQWDEINNDDPAVSFDVFSSFSQETWVQVNTEPVYATEFVDSTEPIGATVFYDVHAVDANGIQSGNSEIVNVVISSANLQPGTLTGATS